MKKLLLLTLILIGCSPLKAGQTLYKSALPKTGYTNTSGQFYKPMTPTTPNYGAHYNQYTNKQIINPAFNPAANSFANQQMMRGQQQIINPASVAAMRQYSTQPMGQFQSSNTWWDRIKKWTSTLWNGRGPDDQTETKLEPTFFKSDEERSRAYVGESVMGQLDKLLDRNVVFPELFRKVRIRRVLEANKGYWDINKSYEYTDSWGIKSSPDYPLKNLLRRATLAESTHMANYYLEIAQLLVDYGADLNNGLLSNTLTDIDLGLGFKERRQTMINRYQVLNWLLSPKNKDKININEIDSRGNTPLDKAQKYKLDDVAKKLKELGAKSGNAYGRKETVINMPALEID